MHDNKITTVDRLEEIKESIFFIELWSANITSGEDFLLSPYNKMAFDACVMRLQVIGEQVGHLLKLETSPLSAYTNIPWQAIYGLRNLISHEYSNIDEDLVYSIIKDDIPTLKIAIEEMLAK